LAINKVDDYIKAVETGEITTCKLVKLAVKRYQNDLKTGEKRGIFFDKKAGNRAIEFIETLIRHTVGPCAGKPFILEGWQTFVLWNLFGWKRKDGSRRFRISFVSLARKNGKSTLAAAVALYMLIGDGESAGEVYSVATKKDQARITFREARRMIKTSPDLKKFARVLMHNISVEESFSKFEALGADSDTLDGLNISCAICDEIHQWKSRELWDVILTAVGARRQPLIFAISTAGFDQTESSICWQQQQHAERILNGTIADDSFFCFIATLDPDDPWDDESCWIKANPNLHISVQLDDLKEEAERVKNLPTGLNPFKRYKLNQWTSSAEAWITQEAWAACDHGEITAEELAGRTCCIGLDLAKKIDTSAMVAVFPPIEDGGDYLAVPFIFLPEDTLAERQKNERIPWLDWKQRELIYTCKGKVNNMTEILDAIKTLNDHCNVIDIVYDRWLALEILPDLVELGFSDDPKDSKATQRAIEFGQGYRDMSPAVRNLEEMVADDRLNHAGHEVLAWQVEGVTTAEDDAGNVKFSKRKSKHKIDAVVALAMAAYRARVYPKPKGPSVYAADRGLIII
jgi:phage terminase large subunit-like protein